MLIIIEGQARTGKTTLARNLAEMIEKTGQKANIFKRKERSENPAVAIIRDLLPLVIDHTAHWIVDRAHITEKVYTAYNSRPKAYPDEAIDWIDECFAASPEVILVYLTADEATLRRRHADTIRPFEGSIKVLSILFDEAILDSDIATIQIDTSGGSELEIAQAVYTMIFNPDNDIRVSFTFASEKEEVWTLPLNGTL